MKSELGGKFETLVLALMETPYEYLALELERAMAGLGTDEDVLTEVNKKLKLNFFFNKLYLMVPPFTLKVLCTRSNQDIGMIAEAFQNKFGKSLEDSIKGEVSGDYKRLLVMLLNVRDNKEDTDNLNFEIVPVFMEC